MRKQFLFIFLALIFANKHQGQTRTTKVGYIDMEYILQNVSDYTEAKAQLELKAQKWKQDIEAKKTDITNLKETLKVERALLTKELIEERETEIKFLENEMLDFQQKQFGVNGMLMQQKAALAKPIQDQVFTAVQDIAEAKKYDFIFDRSSDLTMLFAAKRFDISDQVLRIITRADKREQVTKKQLELEEQQQAKLDAIEENPALSERQKIAEEKKVQREKILAERKLAQDQKQKEYEERRNAILAEREAKKNGTVSETAKTQAAPATNTTAKSVESDVEEEIPTKTAAETKAEERQRLYEERKKELELRRQKILEEREAAKKAKETTTPSETSTKN
ncbi:OmpH family outer membrane protein [Flavobacterium agrisoli]|uniref:OmpH family outer membrane protein n=1 Tax=Flavobacterium agrisoli TaxID=2793066 RepID=A0A934PLC6_9FLAO|nr:OmpH family outer membrane protein [Flavobacterium agrisoli]MBK0370287.1 OmpH family outer membrane protein [Flavobacterium agrisoli]